MRKVFLKIFTETLAKASANAIVLLLVTITLIILGIDSEIIGKVMQWISH